MLTSLEVCAGGDGTALGAWWEADTQRHLLVLLKRGRGRMGSLMIWRKVMNSNAPNLFHYALAQAQLRREGQGGLSHGC